MLGNNHSLPSRPHAAEMAVVLIASHFRIIERVHIFRTRTSKACKDYEKSWQDRHQEHKQKAHCIHPTTDESRNKSKCLKIYSGCFTLKPVGHQSTNWIVRLVLMLATAACTSLGTTSPRYNKQQATARNTKSSICYQETYDNSLYLPSLGSHFTIWLPFSKQAKVISATEFCSWVALSTERSGA